MTVARAAPRPAPGAAVAPRRGAALLMRGHPCCRDCDFPPPPRPTAGRGGPIPSRTRPGVEPLEGRALLSVDPDRLRRHRHLPAGRDERHPLLQRHRRGPRRRAVEERRHRRRHVLVEDINPGAGSSSPRSLTVVGSTVFFSANDGANGTELWKSDGTAAGTALVKDIYPGSGGSYPAEPDQRQRHAVLRGVRPGGGLRAVEERRHRRRHRPGQGHQPRRHRLLPGEPDGRRHACFFTANDGTHGTELWKSDGTAAGTVLVKDINPGTASVLAVGPDQRERDAVLRGQRRGRTASSCGRATAPPPAPSWSRTSTPGRRSSIPSFLTNVERHALLHGQRRAHGTELWKSDGTAAGTVLVKDIYPGGDRLEPVEPDDRERHAVLHGQRRDPRRRSCGRATAPPPAPCWSRTSTPAAAARASAYLTDVDGTLFFSAYTTGLRDRAVEERRHGRRHGHGQGHLPGDHRLQPDLPDGLRLDPLLHGHGPDASLAAVRGLLTRPSRWRIARAGPDAGTHPDLDASHGARPPPGPAAAARHFL